MIAWAISGAGRRSVPHSLVASSPWRPPRTSHMPGSGFSTFTSRVRSSSFKNCACTSALIHTAPMRALISSTPSASGTTSVSASTLAWNAGSSAARSVACSSFMRTSPERYAGAWMSSSVIGSVNTSPVSEARASVSSMPSMSAISGRSILPVRSRLTAIASAGVSTPWGSVRGETTRRVMIAAGVAVWSVSSNCSKASTSAPNGSERSSRIGVGTVRA